MVPSAHPPSFFVLEGGRKPSFDLGLSTDPSIVLIAVSLSVWGVYDKPALRPFLGIWLIDICGKD